MSAHLGVGVIAAIITIIINIRNWPTNQKLKMHSSTTTKLYNMQKSFVPNTLIGIDVRNNEYCLLQQTRPHQRVSEVTRQEGSHPATIRSP